MAGPDLHTINVNIWRKSHMPDVYFTHVKRSPSATINAINTLKCTETLFKGKKDVTRYRFN